MMTPLRSNSAAVRTLSRMIVLGVSLLSSSASLVSASSIRLVYDKQVSITVTIALIDQAGTSILHEQTLEGEAGERLMLDTLLTDTRQDIPWSFRASFKMLEDRKARQAADTGESILEWRTRTALGRNEPVRTHRRTAVENGRLAVAEIWGRTNPTQRLVMQISAQWKQVPQLVRTAPTAEPIGLIIEVLGRRNDRSEVLESHRVFGLMGDASKISFERTPGHGTPSDEVHVTVIPHHVSENGVRLALQIHYRETLEAGKTVPTIRNISEDVPAGSSITLDIPEAAGRPALAVRVTPLL